MGRDYCFIERYNRGLKKWEVVMVRDLLEGDMFFVYDHEGALITDEDGKQCFEATCDAYDTHGEGFVVEYK